MHVPLRFIGYLSRNKTSITLACIVLVSAGLIAFAVWIPWPTKAPYGAILLGLGTSAGATMVIQVLTNSFTGWLRKIIDQRFEEFFGKGSLTREVRGKILLQSDSINTLMKTLLGENSTTFASVKDALDKPENNRLFKARHWLNTRDAISARTIRDKIRSFGFPTPDLEIIEHPQGQPQEDPFEDYQAAPYVISMGLAFTETSIFLAKQCDPANEHFVIVENSVKGDALAVPEGFGFDPRLFEIRTIDDNLRPPDVSGTWYWLFPRQWNIDKWREELETAKKAPNDYAVVIRYRAGTGSKQVRFMAAGFTENTTATAGEYLVENWEYLWERFVSKKIENFVVVVHREKQYWRNPIQVFP